MPHPLQQENGNWKLENRNRPGSSIRPFSIFYFPFSTPFSCSSVVPNSSPGAGAAEALVDATGGGHALGDRVHHFLTSVHAIPAGKILRVRGLVTRVDDHAPVLVQVDAQH